MPEVLVCGEALVEIMRPGLDVPLDEPGPFEGPYPSGAPAIAADALSRLGVPVGFISAVGDDDFGRCVMRRMTASGVDVRHVQRISQATTAMAFVTYFRDGTRRFLFHLRGSAAAALRTDLVDGADLQGVRYLHLSGSTLAISEDLRAQCLHLADRVRAAGGRISFDPNFRAELLAPEPARVAFAPFVRRAAVLLPSGPEACWLTGDADPDRACRQLVAAGTEVVVLKRGAAGATAYTARGVVSVPGFAVFAPFVRRAAVLLPSGPEACWLTGDADPDRACRRLVAAGTEVVVLKRGAAGATAYTARGVVSVPGFAVGEVDPTGAGDCFAAGLLAALLEGASVEQALILANGAGAMAVTRRGPMEGTPTRRSLEEFLARASTRH